jgi:hypothetical protein
MTLHPNLAKSFGITRKTKKYVRFGSQTYQTNIYLSNDVPLNEASLSADIMDKLNIPHHCSLEVRKKGKDILIGPYIGILAGCDQSTIKEKLVDILDYLFYYREIKGAIIVFSLENADKINHTVNGYLYNPKTKQWEEGTFPYPSSIIIKTSSVSPDWIKHFKSILGETIFNDIPLNRWGTYKKLAASLEVKNYLPEAILYEDPHDLYYFLKKFFNVNVKAINTFNQSSRKVILRDSKTMVISNPLTNEMTNFKFSNKDQAYSIFNRYFNEVEYFIQESINVSGYRTIELRVILVKNQQDQWQAMGIFTRDNKSGNDLRNMQPIVKLEKDRLKELLQKSDVYISMVYQELINIAIEGVKALENSGSHLANAAVDLVIGEIGDIWILDIEHSNPSHEIALVAGYPELYFETLKTLMLNAKKLAGF